MENTSGNIRNSLYDLYLYLNKSRDITGIFEADDSFVELSQGNAAVQCVVIYPYDENDAGSYELWGDKVVSRGVGNLKSLRTLRILLDNEGDTSELDWEILARILQQVSPAINLEIPNGYIAGSVEMRAFGCCGHSRRASCNYEI
jgi:hypothetical protein